MSWIDNTESKKQRILLLRLKFKRVDKRLDKAIHENFGYCPSYPWFDKLIDDRRCCIDELKSYGIELDV